MGLESAAWLDLLIPACWVLGIVCDTAGDQLKSIIGSGELGAMFGGSMSMSMSTRGSEELEGSGEASVLSGVSGGSRVPPSWKGPVSWEEAIGVVLISFSF